MSAENSNVDRVAQAEYVRRINGLGKCLLLWAGQYSRFGADDFWDNTRMNVDHLMSLIDDMANAAAQIDQESVGFWQQMRLVLLKAR
jgi:hypothetical protein